MMGGTVRFCGSMQCLSVGTVKHTLLTMSRIRLDVDALNAMKKRTLDIKRRN
jgi:hypothetical protein